VVPDALTGGPHFAAYCERYIRHTKGRWAGRPLVYEDWQREFWWEALFERVEVLGLRRMRIEPTPSAVAAGLVEAFSSASAGYGRGERI
jgi:hypothetical protein